ncbi:hypothetical protein [Streptomyces beihaiensis]|uniref:Uncharacterized protein n=1 Tax=Streptomyces beihaiensis TaxID=2984495 RepID=A0ABT3TUP3_9ACTN|nr:hypothetical protein [Streptomyces beihaiensis]MCX3060759.1 hypothetical protein [Streptomyces beihaiensis]
MTVVAERTAHTQMSVEEFEKIAAFTGKETEGTVRLEFIDGRIGTKKAADAAADIPVYLQVDRDAGAVVMHSKPDVERAEYRDVHTAHFGERVCLPDPVGIELDTEQLKQYVR